MPWKLQRTETLQRSNDYDARHMLHKSQADIGRSALHAHQKQQFAKVRWRLVVAHPPYIRVHDHTNSDTSEFNVRVECSLHASLETVYDLLTKNSKRLRVFETLIPNAFRTRKRMHKEMSTAPTNNAHSSTSRQLRMQNQNEHVAYRHSATLSCDILQRDSGDRSEFDKQAFGVSLYTYKAIRESATRNSDSLERVSDDASFLYHLLRFDSASHPKKPAYKITYHVKETAKTNVLKVQVFLSAPINNITDHERTHFKQRMYEDATALSCLQPFVDMMRESEQSQDRFPLKSESKQVTFQTTCICGARQALMSQEREILCVICSRPCCCSCSFPIGHRYVKQIDQKAQDQKRVCKACLNANMKSNSSSEDVLSCSTSTTSKTLEDSFVSEYKKPVQTEVTSMERAREIVSELASGRLSIESMQSLRAYAQDKPRIVLY